MIVTGAERRNDVAEQPGAETVFDTLLTGGLVLDGTGQPGFRADIGLRGDRIAAVGDLSQAQAGVRIDAGELHIAPGFIDIHTHSDVSIGWDTGQASALAMGVTTQVVGNCGLSLGFATDGPNFALEKRWIAPHGARIRWKSFDEHLRQIEANGLATHFVPLAGHGTLRKRIMGMEERPPAADDMAQMRRELEAALQAGVWGFTSGLEYPPSAYADEDELAELCAVVADYGGFYATHLRNEGDTLIESVQEALNVAERACLPLQLSHHKAENRANWGKVQTTLQMVDAARARGLDVQIDQYPYTAFMTALGIQILPRWALSGKPEETTARLLDPVQRQRIVTELRIAHPEWDDRSATSPWHNIQVGVCRTRPEAQGYSIAILAAGAGRDPLDFALDLIAETAGNVSAVNFAMREEDVATVMRYPWTSIGSDAVGTHPEGTNAQDQIHPRTYGTFPRVLGRYVRELGLLTEAEAIHKMTGLPAARLGLRDRGRIAPGMAADLTLYNPATVGDAATFATPHQYAHGIETVLVHGRIAYTAGHPTDARAGAVLRRAGSPK
ncbi:MAG: dihydroorotase [Chthonomonadaceae bacterium]|nr:dihydroorotase [Chthonomonadaceae bacterium]